MPISKPGTWENGFKNSPQAETTQLREMGVYLNTQGKFDALDNSWNNILNNSPITYRASALREPAGIYLTEKGIGLGINPMSPEVDFNGTFGILVREEINVYDPELTSATLTLGNFNNSDDGVRAELTWYWSNLWPGVSYPGLWMFAYDYTAAVDDYQRVHIQGKPLLLNQIFLGSGVKTTVEMFGGFMTSHGNVGIGTQVEGTISGGAATSLTGDFNLCLANGTAPSGAIAGIQIYAESGAAKVMGSGGTITTFGAADPHCQRCGKDFAMEWENEKYGKLSICAWCLSEKFEDIVIEKYEGGN